MNKRILSILLSVVMVMSLLVLAIPVGAADTASVTITPDKTEAKPGDTVTFTITISAFENVNSIDITPQIPAGLTYVDKSATTDPNAKAKLGYDDFSFSDDGGKLVCGGVGSDFEQSTSEAITLGTFQATVDADASGEYTVTAGVELYDLYEDAYREFNVVPAAVTVAADEQPTEAPATEAPATEAPATEAPATETPATEAPATETPATEAPQPATEAPHEHNLIFVAERPATTEAEGTKAHYVCDGCDKLFSDATGNIEVTPEELVIPKIVPTEAPATEAPATEAPATEAPATEAPATEAPATEAPATEAPATEAPATEAPATEAPATEAPATEAHEHTYVLVAEVPATKEFEGVKAHYECEGCELLFVMDDAGNYVEVAAAELTIPKLADETVAPTDAATKDQATKDQATKDQKSNNSPKTGDSTNMTLWMFIMLASLVGACVVLYAAKRKGLFTK